MLLSRVLVLWKNTDNEMGGLGYTPSDEGVVFYVYSWDSCRNGNGYMQQLKFNIDSVHEKDPRVWYYYRVTE